MLALEREQLHNTVETSRLFLTRYQSAIDELDAILILADVAAYDDEYDREISDKITSIITAGAQFELTHTQLAHIRKAYLSR